MILILPKYFSVGMEDNKGDLLSHFFTSKDNHLLFCKTTNVTHFKTLMNEKDINGLLSTSFSYSSLHFDVGVTKFDTSQQYLWGHTHSKRYKGYLQI